jgi:8-oxo-dGTP pyrophosphatase MutT (NUDIX family)
MSAPHPDPGDALIDLLDERGEPIGVVTRREMRRRRLPHRCTYLLVFNRRGELYIHLRTPTKDVFPSYWDLCAGGVNDAGESFDDGARRELFEELGVEAEPEPLFPIRFEDEATIVFGMAYRVVHDGPFRLQAEEVVRGEFIAIEDLDARIGRDPFCPDGLKVWAEYRLRR